MPSLHIANSLFFLLSAARSRRLRWLAVAYGPVVAFFVVEGVATGWHYYIDFLAGAVLAAAALVVGERWVPGGGRVGDSPPART